MKKGIFCISIDTELLWGRKDLNYAPFVEKTKREREVINILINLFEKYSIPATWAIVGKLFLDPPKNCTDPNLWYAKDVIKLLRKSTKQEIGCHSYSHPEFTKLSHKQADAEIYKCLTIGNKMGIKLKSFVFPRNLVAHTDLLAKYKFTGFRGLHPYRPTSLSPGLNKIFQLADLLLLIPHAYKPQVNNGLVNIPGSMYYISDRGLRSLLPVKVRVLKAKRGIDKAISEKKIFHLWFHPVDFAGNTNRLIKGLEEIVKYASTKRKQGVLDIRSMQEISGALLSGSD